MQRLFVVAHVDVELIKKLLGPANDFQMGFGQRFLLGLVRGQYLEAETGQFTRQHVGLASKDFTRGVNAAAHDQSAEFTRRLVDGRDGGLRIACLGADL